MPNHNENKQFIAHMMSDVKLKRAQSIPDSHIILFNIEKTPEEIIVNSKITGSTGNEYQIYVRSQQQDNILELIHDCPDFGKHTSNFCKHIGKLFLFMDPADVAIILKPGYQFNSSHEIRKVEAVKRESEMINIKNLIDQEKYDEAIDQIISLIQKNKNFEILNEALDITYERSLSKAYIRLAHVILQENVLFNVDKISYSSDMGIFLNLSSKKYLLENYNIINSTLDDLTQKINYDFLIESIRKTILKLERETKLNQIETIYLLIQIAQILPLNIFKKFIDSCSDPINNSHISYPVKKLFTLPIQNIIQNEGSNSKISVSSKQILVDSQDNSSTINLLDDLMLDFAPPNIIHNFLGFSYLMGWEEGQINLIKESVRKYEISYDTKIREYYIHRLQYIKRILYEYHNGKAIEYYANFSPRAGGRYITISGRPSSPFEIYFRQKLGVDVSHSDYIIMEDYKHNYPLLKEIYDAPDYSFVYDFWGESIPLVHLSSITYEDEMNFQLNIESDLKSYCIIEWDLNVTPMYGSSLYQIHNGYMIPDPNIPLSDKLSPFDLTLCEITPTRNRGDVKYFKPIHIIPYSEIFKYLNNDIDVISSYVPLKLIQDLLQIYRSMMNPKAKIKRSGNISNNKEISTPELSFFGVLDKIKKTVNETFFPKKAIFLEEFNKQLNKLMSKNVEYYFKILKSEDPMIVGPYLLSMIDYNSLKKIFIDAKNQIAKDAKDVSKKRSIITSKLTDSDFLPLKEEEMADLTKTRLLIRRFILSNYKNMSSFTSLQESLFKFIRDRLVQLRDDKEGFTNVNLGVLQKYPFYHTLTSEFVVKRYEELRNTQITVKSRGFDISAFRKTYYGGLIAAKLVKSPGVIISQEELSAMQKELNLFGVNFALETILVQAPTRSRK